MCFIVHQLVGGDGSAAIGADGADGAGDAGAPEDSGGFRCSIRTAPCGGLKANVSADTSGFSFQSKNDTVFAGPPLMSRNMTLSMRGRWSSAPIQISHCMLWPVKAMWFVCTPLSVDVPTSSAMLV